MSKLTTNKFSAEVRDRAVRMVFDRQAEHPSQWAAINSIAVKEASFARYRRPRERRVR